MPGQLSAYVLSVHVYDCVNINLFNSDQALDSESPNLGNCNLL